MCSISSRTNSPACVPGDLPSRLSRLARSIASFSGISTPLFSRILFARIQNATAPLRTTSTQHNVLSLRLGNTYTDHHFGHRACHTLHCKEVNKKYE